MGLSLQPCLTNKNAVLKRIAGKNTHGSCLASSPICMYSYTHRHIQMHRHIYDFCQEAFQLKRVKSLHPDQIIHFDYQKKNNVRVQGNEFVYIQTCSQCLLLLVSMPMSTETVCNLKT